MYSCTSKLGRSGKRVNSFARLPEARGFLTARVKYLETLDEDAATHHALAATHYLLQHYSKALEYARKALGGDPDTKELLWHHELVVRQNKVLQEGADKLAGLALSEHLKMPKAAQVCMLKNLHITPHTPLLLS